MNSNPRHSFKLPQLPLKELNWGDFIELSSKANFSLATFGSRLESIPEPSLLLSPLANKEAVSSSRIEGTKTTFEEFLKQNALSKLINDDDARYDWIDISNYRRAMAQAVQLLEELPLSKNLFCRIHKTLLKNSRGHSKDPGSFRRVQVYVGNYTPPPAQEVPDLFSSLEKYIHYDDRDRLIQLAIIHAQFELIHPFLDGNGRTGRILIPLFLYYKKILKQPMFYLSEYFEDKRSDYYHFLNGISADNNWQDWINFFLRAVIEQSQTNTHKISQILQLYDTYKSDLSTAIPVPRNFLQVLDFIFANPVFIAKKFIQDTGTSSSSAFRILRFLIDKEILTVNKDSKNGLYVFDELLGIIR